MKRPSDLVKIGFFVLLASALVYFGLNYLKGLAVFSREYSYYARFTHVEGLAIASPVKINGYKVGTVQGLDFEIDPQGQASTLVRINIDKKYKIPQGSVASIKASLFGGAQIDLRLASTTQYLAEGDYFKSNESHGDLMTMLSEDLMPKVVQMVPRVDSILASAQQFVADPKLRQAIHEAHSALLAARSSMQRIESLIGQIQGYASHDLPPLLAKANNSMAHVDNFSQQLDSINIKQIAQNLESTSNELRTLTQQLNSKEGTFGKVINDEQLYRDLQSLLTKTDSLVGDFKANPRKYIKFSIF